MEEKLEQEKVFNNKEENFEPVAIAHGEVQHTEEMVCHLKRELEEELQEANGWIKEVKGTRNAWNNPLVAVPKVSGGKTDPKDIRLCVDARPGNSTVMGPEYNLLKFSTMFQ